MCQKKVKRGKRERSIPLAEGCPYCLSAAFAVCDMFRFSSLFKLGVSDGLGNGRDNFPRHRVASLRRTGDREAHTQKIEMYSLFNRL